MLIVFRHSEHLVFSINFPPQFLHDSSGNSFQRKLIRIEYKQNVEVVHLKDQLDEDYNGNKEAKNHG